MRRLPSFVICAVVIGTATHASAHGFRIDIDSGNKLVLHSDDPSAGANSIYKVQALSPLSPATTKFTDHPGFDVDTPVSSSGFSGGEAISFDVLGPLWYSSGGVPAHAPADIQLQISPQDGSPNLVTVTGTSGFQNGFLIGNYSVYDPSVGLALGAYEHQLYYEFDDIATPVANLPVGAYALAFRLTGTNAADQPFTPSDPFVAAFNNGLAIGGFPGVANQLFTAALAVPEPSSIALAAMASIGLTAFHHRRRRTRTS